MQREMTALPGPRERKKGEIRSRIIDTAMDLLDKQGFEATTVDQIAEKADVAKSILYNYFPAKEAILAVRSAPAAAQSTRWLEAGWRSRRTQWVEMRGYSMAPALAAGDLIRVSPLAGAPSTGDTVVILLGGRLVAHRVVAVNDEVIVTRGDACAAADPQVPLAAVFGRVVEVRRSLWRRIRARLGGLK